MARSTKPGQYRINLSPVTSTVALAATLVPTVDDRPGYSSRPDDCMCCSPLLRDHADRRTAQYADRYSKKFRNDIGGRYRGAIFSRRRSNQPIGYSRSPTVPEKLP
jgi:hypothetical protein